MAHKFDVRNKHKLDNEKRREILPPHKALKELRLQEGDTIADIGCGIGYFSIPAAQIVGESGKVFAMDISLEMIEELERKAENNNISNIKAIVTEENDLKVDDNSVSYAFICNVLHETQDMKLFLTEVKRILTDCGKLVIVEWKKENTDYGPPLEHRLSKEEVYGALKHIGLNNMTYQEVGAYFYAVIAEK
ncbi:methyltransferase domain-containing protein [Petroclostridium sp. X23]|uniref:class I SAM-dependent methyltransferase n=1 Tax=Petroclostridium sp. X23 TaxID=3045146 RepID=UPI0024ACF3F6|nr:methyltransferase domain-containing protein [Petroclostridium sp. X23]WHH61090.1 class I SAM-dependent methyltransferase [Petroclostridium sp. X23]